jgi:hypothetical protein
MRPRNAQEWFNAYLETFAAFGRGDRNDIAALLEYYDVPLLFTTDRGAFALNSEERVARALTEQLDGMRAADYDHSDVLEARMEILNTVCSLYRGHFSRRARDGSEMGHVRVTYVVTDRGAGRRIAALIVHSA